MVAKIVSALRTIASMTPYEATVVLSTIVISTLVVNTSITYLTWLLRHGRRGKPSPASTSVSRLTDLLLHPFDTHSLSMAVPPLPTFSLPAAAPSLSSEPATKTTTFRGFLPSLPHREHVVPSDVKSASTTATAAALLPALLPTGATPTTRIYHGHPDPRDDNALPLYAVTPASSPSSRADYHGEIARLSAPTLTLVLHADDAHVVTQAGWATTWRAIDLGTPAAAVTIPLSALMATDDDDDSVRQMRMAEVHVVRQVLVAAMWFARARRGKTGHLDVQWEETELCMDTEAEEMMTKT